jgi:hypothetical protein
VRCVACSLEEVDQMARELRKNSKRPIPEDASGFQVIRCDAVPFSYGNSVLHTCIAIWFPV